MRSFNVTEGAARRGATSSHAIAGLTLLALGLVGARQSQAQQFDFTGPFGRTVGPATDFTADSQLLEESAEQTDSTDPAAKIAVTGARVRESQVHWLLVPTIITADDLNVYALSAGASFGPNQVLVRYSNIDPDGADSIDQYFGQYKRTLTQNIGVFGFASRTQGTRLDYGAAASFGAAIASNVEVAGNAGWQLRENDTGPDENDFLARAGVLWKPQQWLQVALDYELENSINDADTTSIEVTLLDKLFFGADSEHTYWGGIAFVF